MSLLIVGTVAFDELITPWGESGRIIGGSATYASLSAANFKSDISIVSIIGEDFPEAKLELMRSKGIDTSGIKRIDGGKTFFWKGKYHQDMNTRDTLETELNVLADFDPVLSEKAKEAEYLMLGNLTPAVQMKVLKQMNQRPKLVIMDTMNFWMDIAMPELKGVLKEVDLLTINDEEARQLSGEQSLLKAARKIFAMGPKFLIIKKGEHGAMLFHEDKKFFCPALPLEEVFDPTGAGDTFAGGFIGQIVREDDISFENMKRGVIYGSAMASFCVEKFGTEKLLNITQKNIDARVGEFIDLVNFNINP
jgi:sugar/nucleoside kinase (ribokinase family)